MPLNQKVFRSNKAFCRRRAVSLVLAVVKRKKTIRRSCIECELMSLVYDKFINAMWSGMGFVIESHYELIGMCCILYPSSTPKITLQITLQIQPT